MDFEKEKAEFFKRCEERRKQEDPNYLANQAKLKQEQLDVIAKRAKEQEVSGKLYNVWKLSIPTHYIKKPVLLNIPEAEARKFIKDASRTRFLDVKDSDSKIIVYYEMFPADDMDPDMYKNPLEITKEAQYGNERPTIIPTARYDEPEWQG